MTYIHIFDKHVFKYSPEHETTYSQISDILFTSLVKLAH